MHISISTGNNTGSSGKLTSYLEKENRREMKESPERWFSTGQKEAEAYEVRRAIDANIAKLTKADAKFFLINISPSKKEIRHLTEKFGETGAKEHLKQYAEKVMNEYAKNFKRPGIECNKDLLWFGKLENFRYYSFTDKEVKSGERKRGEKKEGEQMHIQIIVSRKDIANKIKLSPMNTSRGKNAEHSQKLGQFNRVAFKHCGEELFDKHFNFDRGLKETMAYANIKKNGSMQQNLELNKIERIVNVYPLKQSDLNKLSWGLALNGNIKDKTIIESLLEPKSFHEQVDYHLQPGRKKKRKKKLRRLD